MLRSSYILGQIQSYKDRQIQSIDLHVDLFKDLLIN